MVTKTAAVAWGTRRVRSVAVRQGQHMCDCGSSAAPSEMPIPAAARRRLVAAGDLDRPGQFLIGSTIVHRKPAIAREDGLPCEKHLARRLVRMQNPIFICHHHDTCRQATQRR